MKEILSFILSKGHIKYTSRGLHEAILTTPNAKSMYGISAILWKYNIENECIKYSIKKDLIESPRPCIVIINGDFRIITSASHSKVTLQSATDTNIISWNYFESAWNGIALHFKTNINSREPNFIEHRRAEIASTFRFIGMLCSMTALTIIGLLNNTSINSWIFWSFLLINGCGIIISFLLLQQQLNIKNRITTKLCGLIKESNCENVTKSGGADFWGLAKLSEMGFSFFAVNLIILILYPQIMSTLAIITALILPFSLWSIWYQKHRAHSWCVLCLCVLLLMWLQFSICILGNFYHTTSIINLSDIISIISCYVVITISTHIIMQLLEKKQMSIYYQAAYTSLKSRDDIIDTIEGKAPKFSTNEDICSDLVFGKRDAKCHITVFSNPYCGPCAKMHKTLISLPEYFTKITYTFTYFNKELSIINRYIIAAYEQLGAKRTWELLSDWYDYGKLQGESFFKNLGLNPNTQTVWDEFKKQEQWSKDGRLTATPTIIINNRLLLDPYNIQDYIYLSL